MEGSAPEPIVLSDRKKKYDDWSKVNRPIVYGGNRLPSGQNKQAAGRDPKVLHSMRVAAARIAVDMERGIFKRLRDGKDWHGAYSKWEIAESMGYNARHNSHLPKLFESPYFEKYVEYERTVRDASYRATMREAMPMLDPVISGFMIEALRRVLIEPEKIPDNVLFTELRKFMVMKGEYEGAFSAPEDVRTLIINFNAQTDKLPEEARQKALDIFKREMASLVPGEKSDFIEAMASIK